MLTTLASPVETLSENKLLVHIRWMIRRDMPEVLAIENECFEFPWCKEDFVRWLRPRNCIPIVAEASERILGFMVYEWHQYRLQVINFAVDKRFRRRSIGTQMVKELISKLSNDRRSHIMIEIRETNLPAQLFFQAQGFRAVSVLHNAFEDTPEDAYLMEYQAQSFST